MGELMGRNEMQKSSRTMYQANSDDQRIIPSLMAQAVPPPYFIPLNTNVYNSSRRIGYGHQHQDRPGDFGVTGKLRRKDERESTDNDDMVSHTYKRIHQNDELWKSESNMNTKQYNSDTLE